MDNQANEICREFGQISGDRGNWESHWEQCAERVLPSYSGLFTGGRTSGEQRTQHIFDSTAPIALTRFASVMESILSPRNQMWHGLVPAARELLKDRATRLWMEDVRNLLFKYRYAPKANFAAQNYQNYIGLGAFGTGCLFIDALAEERGLRYRAIHLGEVYFCENHQGIVDKVYRRFEMTARQAVQKWGGNGKLPQKITTEAGKNPETKFWFLHCVKPREDYEPDRFDSKGMRFVSFYVAEADKVTLSEGGYRTFPYAISRYVQAPGEIYGRSPAMEVLPAIKTLNEEKKTMLRTGHKKVDPVMLVHDDGILDTLSARPGAVVSGGVNADGRQLVHTLPVGDLQAGHELMQLEMTAINDAFLVTLFQILVETPQMTATEVLERAREKGMLLSPTAGRQQSEYQGPLIERELDVLAQQGMLPPMPPALRELGGEYQVEYTSPLARAQRAEEASGFMRWTETLLNVAAQTQDPSALDHVDFDVAAPELADIMAVPIRWVRPMDAIKAIREGRQQQAETQQMIEAAPAAASMMKGAQK